MQQRISCVYETTSAHNAITGDGIGDLCSNSKCDFLKNGEEHNRDLFEWFKFKFKMIAKRKGVLLENLSQGRLGIFF